VAVHVDGEVRAVETRAGQRHSELALPMLNRLLNELSFSTKDLHAIAFGAGPGSFTGLRIACGLAQGLALGLGAPVLGLSSFEAMAEESGATRVLACLDARMREVYYAALEKQAGAWRETIGAQCIAPSRVPRPPGDGWIGCGSGFALAHPWNETFGTMPCFPEIHPTAAAIARLAAPRLARGEGVDAADAMPFYLRDKVALTIDERRT
jgi:tRNA threonylcarbamoyladenosine biosynthesis protein TsaB